MREPSASSPSRSRSTSAREPAGRRELRGEDARVEHVEVEVHEDRVALERAREPPRAARCRRPRARARRARRRRGRARRIITTRAGSSTASSPSPASQRPHAAARHMPPRKPLGVVAGVLKSPCASSHTNRVSGTWRSTVGSVVMQIEQSEASRTGKSPGRHGVVDLAAGLEDAAARVAQVVLPVPRAASSPGEPICRTSTPSSRASRGASASTPRTPPGVRSEVRQRSAIDRGVAHRPVHSGSRFSKNAFTPSWMSSVANAIASCARR